ncbi:uncharacterized protein LOC141690560 [Apium graveolens]|uniref:uncharacterized protein LOC141690560 n=1 Tax=Apium graveolens TaxID=4045 RepID=UPI003D7A4B0C
MEDDYSSWIGFPKSSKEYVRGIKAFLENSFPIYAKGEEMKCPCKVCVNRYWHTQTVIYDHLICSGPSPLHMKWICEVSHTKVDGSTNFMDSGTGMDFEDNFGEMFNCTGKKFRDSENDYESLTNAEARKFYGHVREGKQPLYPGSTKFSRLSFLIKLYHLKCAHGIPESAFGELLELIRDAFPDAQIPLSLNAVKNMIKDLGLHYEKIHACRNNCMLYWGENNDKEKCDNCGVSRWVLPEKKGNDASDPGQVIHKVPANVMRYFPLNPRLQRLYMCKEYSKLMKWHDVGHQQDGKHSKKMCYMNHRKFLPSAHKWRIDTKRFNGAIEMGQCPSLLTGTDIEELLSGYINQFGLQNKKAKSKTEGPFKKNISGKTKDHVAARKDLQEMGIRKPLHPFTIKTTTKPEVAVPLMKLSACLRALWSKVIDLEELEKLETEIVEHLRNMFPIERYLAKLKSYVRNRSKTEGSIAEGYIAEEYVTFCSRFLAADETTKNNMCSTVFERGPTQAEYHIGTRMNKDVTIIHLEDVDWKASHRYVYSILGTSSLGGQPRKYEQIQEVTKTHGRILGLVTRRGWENGGARRFTGYVVNGYRFHTSDRDSRCTTQNSGVYLTAQTTSFSSSRYENPIVGDVSYYGSLEDIIELDYWGLFTVVLFKCRWYQQQKDSHGHIRVNFNRLCHKSDPHVLAKQVQ